jgi:hypothetical protein
MDSPSVYSFFDNLLREPPKLLILIVITLVVGHIFSVSVRVSFRLLELLKGMKEIRLDLGLLISLVFATQIVSILTILALHNYFALERKGAIFYLFLFIVIIPLLIFVPFFTSRISQHKE